MITGDSMKLTQNNNEWEINGEQEALEIMKQYFYTNQHRFPDYINCYFVYLPDPNFIKYEVGNNDTNDSVIMEFYLELDK